MKVCVLRYNAGNARSVLLALERLGVNAVWTDEKEMLNSADRVIFPGVGEASSAAAYLQERGLFEVLANLKQPVLGICLGLHLMCRSSEEGATEGMGLYETEVVRFQEKRKIPHMGWNRITELSGPLFKGVEEGSFVYFVHSYFARLNGSAIASTEYGERFASALGKENFFSVQFHPEKSGRVGERILKNFLEL